MIRERNKNSIIRGPYVEEINITVEATKGIVDLSGKVDTKLEKEQEGKIASDVKGVIAVNNNLKITEKTN